MKRTIKLFHKDLLVVFRFFRISLFADDKDALQQSIAQSIFDNFREIWSFLVSNKRFEYTIYYSSQSFFVTPFSIFIQSWRNSKMQELTEIQRFFSDIYFLFFVLR